LAYDAGFRGDALKWAVAIAMAESGGDPGAYNPEIAAGTKPGSGSRGLWQIYGSAHPQYNSSLAFDPVVNARAAFEVYRNAGYKFTPWSAYNKHTADKFYNGLALPPPRDSGNGSGQSAVGLGAASGGVASSLPGYVGGASPQDKGPLAAAQQTATALQDIASGKFIENAFAKFDKVSFAFYVGGILLMLIGLFVIFQKPATALVIEGTKAAVTGGLSTVL
jgi:hypothetical protein